VFVVCTFTGTGTAKEDPRTNATSESATTTSSASGKFPIRLQVATNLVFVARCIHILLGYITIPRTESREERLLSICENPTTATAGTDTMSVTENRSQKVGLLDPKTMDGPAVSYTVHDLFRSNPKLFLTYHVASTPFDVFNTIGVILGTGLYGCGVRAPAAVVAQAGNTSAVAIMSSTTGLTLGCIGMVLGLTKLSMIASQGENATPIPYNDDGIQQRVNGLSHNFMVRIIDLSCWSGMGLAATALIVAGGPSNLKLSTGTLGIFQALSLGSALGGLGAFGCLYSVHRRNKMDDEE
jgi:hypothetical protein